VTPTRVSRAVQVVGSLSLRTQPARGLGQLRDKHTLQTGEQEMHGATTWWALLDHVDPISLEPLSALQYPPFELKAAADTTSSSDFFDGRTLAMWLVSSGNFSHPLSRRELLRSEIVALDTHLRRHRIDQGICEVARVFDQQSRAGSTVPQELSTARREMAAMLENWLYQQRSAASALADSAAAPPARRVRNTDRTRSGRAAARAAARAASENVVSRGSDGLAVFDDDQLPSHARATARRPPAGSVVTAADYGEWSDEALARTSCDAAPKESFPALPTASRSTSASTPTLPPIVAQAAAARAAAKEAAASAAAEALAAMLARASGMRQAVRDAAGETLAAKTEAAAKAFTQEALGLARSTPGLVEELEQSFDAFIASGERRRPLRPMPRQHRRLTHELCHLYFIGTVASGVEPRRFISLVRTERTTWPYCTLSEAATMEGADHLNGTTREPPSSSSKPPPFGWPIHLFQVQCTEAALSSIIGPACRQHGAYSVEYAPERKRDRHEARVALRLRARLVFSSADAAWAVLNTIGGGCRGCFRVEPPSWTGHSTVHPAGGPAVKVDLEMTSTASSSAVALRLLLSGGAPCTALPTSRAARDASREGSGTPSRAIANPSRSRRRAAARAAPSEAWSAEHDEWTAEHAELHTSLVAMGFAEQAARRACLRVGSHPSGIEGKLEAAIDWLASLTPEDKTDDKADDALGGCGGEVPESAAGKVPHAAHSVACLPPRPHEDQGRRAAAAPTTIAARPGAAVGGNRWAALLDDE
jgi:hypothetical protein